MLKKQLQKSPKTKRNLLKCDYEEDLSQSFLASLIRLASPLSTLFIKVLFLVYRKK